VKYSVVIAGITINVLDALLRLALRIEVPLEPFVWGCVGWLEWTFLAPVAVRVATAVRYRRGHRLRFFVLHITAGLGISVVHTAVYYFLRILVRGMPERPGQSTTAVLFEWLPIFLSLDLLVYGGTVLATQMTLYRQAARRREEERLALERSLARAELDRYKLELPVDMVNERLLEIERAIVRDADQAELLIEEFGASLRESLAAVTVHADVDEIAQEEEEMEEELPPALPWPLRLVPLFSILPAAQVFTSILFAVSATARNQPLSWIPVLRSLWICVEYFPVTLAMVWLGTHVRRVSLLAAAAATIPVVWHSAVTAALHGVKAGLRELTVPDRFYDFLLFLGIALGALAHARYRRWRATAVEVAQLESKVLRTRAAILRLQLNPHFLFNALNSVAALLEDDTAAASKMAAQLRHFVTRVLATSDREEVPLDEELDSLTAYVAIENVRFDGRVKLDIRAEERARRALVPSFLLQPLVENALRHGLMPATGGRVSVLATLSDGTLHIAIDDDGRAYEAEKPAREGLGLSNTRARLTQMYGDEFLLDTTARPDGFDVALAIPCRTAA
jgi:two-component sensor histidine kinase